MAVDSIIRIDGESLEPVDLLELGSGHWKLKVRLFLILTIK